jgi:uncharacterized protein (TIGR03083 family)
MEDLARTWARTANEAFADLAEYLRSLPDEDWDGPTACTKWSIHDLAAHAVGEAVWFANLARGVTVGEPALPDDLYDSMKAWPPDRLVHALDEAADTIQATIDSADTGHLEQTVDLGFTRMPLGQATYVSMFEAVFHNWDARAGQQPGATIPTVRALQLTMQAVEFAPFLTNRKGGAEAPGTYLLQVGDGVGPVTVIAKDGTVRVERGVEGKADVTLHLIADQYMRLLAGRLDLSKESSDVAVEGDRARATGLNRIFQGV